MGGNAIKSSKRMNKEQYITYCSELKNLFPELKMQVSRSYYQKQDFGDIDIVVQTDPNINIKNLVHERISPIEEYDNGPFYSFLYKDSQVDFIFQSPENFQIAYEYFSWQDICNFIGRIARTLNFKFGHDGLFYEKHLNDHYKLSVLVSKDIEKILTFLGYDYETWTKGFDTIESILKYAESSPYFNSLYFSLNEQNHIDRVRNKKRKMYQNMLKYINDNNILPKPKLTEEERQKHFDRAIEMFGDVFSKEVIKAEIEYQTHLTFKKYFNGDIVSSLTGLVGKELGQFMRELKDEEDAIAVASFKEKVLKFGEEYVKGIILKKYAKEFPQKELMKKIEAI